MNGPKRTGCLGGGDFHPVDLPFERIGEQVDEHRQVARLVQAADKGLLASQEVEGVV